MRVVAFLGQLVILIASGAVLAWGLASIAMRLAVRRFERLPPLRNGSIRACYAFLVLLALVPSAFLSIAAWLVYRVAERLPGALNFPDGPTQLWNALFAVAMASMAAAGVIAAFREGAMALRAERRLRALDAGTDDSSAPSPATLLTGPSRRIVILCDGTSNRPDQIEDGQEAVTNIVKLYRGLISDETQTTWYQAGVGSDTSTTALGARRTRAFLNMVGANVGAQVAATWSRFVKLFESAFGSGISEEILNGYTEVVRQYRPGDRLYLLGFSRGAYTARCIAGVISRCGLLRAENIRYAPEMVRLYRMRHDQHAYVQVRLDLIHDDPPIEFLGAFDTVASLGVPLWGWWFRVLPIWKMKALATDPVMACRHVYHALSMDERRSEFFPTLFHKPAEKRDERGRVDRLETLKQVWFRGAHADIGGGYGRHELSDITLGWMMDAMAKHGLAFDPTFRATLKPNPLGRLHDEMTRDPLWMVFGSWPRWHPVPGEGVDPCGTTLHESVLRRAVTVMINTGRPDLMTLAAGEAVEFTVEAQRDWDRTGVVIEQGATYLLTYLGARWRDADSPPCCPDGQVAPSWFDLRHWMSAGRRMPQEPWMMLVATVAHPRIWKLRERGLREFVRMLFRNDPAELTRQLAPIGGDLSKSGDTVLLQNDAPAGLLYFFANDWWQTASNNSGGVRLRLARIALPSPAAPLWNLKPDGSWCRSAASEEQTRCAGFGS